MEDTFILCPDDENRMLDPIDTFFYDLSGRVGWSLALAASFLTISSSQFAITEYSSS
jgi:hypothetical protein